MNNMNEEDLFNKYFPDNFRVKVERNVRKILVNTGIYKRIKKVAKKILGK